MKEIDLPITRTFASLFVDLHDPTNQEAIVSGKIIPLGTIDFSKGADINQARTNGGLIIWSAICLEQKLEEIITLFLFPELKDANDHKRHSFFSERIMKSGHLSFSTKRKLIIDILNSESLLTGNDKNEFEKLLSNVMKYRNAFAHGNIIYSADRGCIHQFSENGPQE
jgi:hypothetical protein